MAIALDDVDLDRDRLLVERAQAGDHTAFGQLYSRYYRRVVRLAVKHVGDPGTAEEIAQEAFVKAYRALPSFAGERRFYPWLSVITRRLCIDAVRRSGRCTVGEIREEPIFDIGFERLEREGDVERLTEALTRIQPRHREVLELREREGWAYQRIADHYSVTIGTVEALLWRARRALRREYEALGSALLGIPLLRRVVGAWSHRSGSPQSSAALTMIGTAAALGLVVASGGTPSAAITATPVAQVAGITTAHPAPPTAASPVSASVSAPARSAPGAPAAASGAAKTGSGVVAQYGPVQFLTPQAANERVDNSPIQVHVGQVGVGASLGDIGTRVNTLISNVGGLAGGPR